MPDQMADFLMRFYGFSAATAWEILGELKDKTSLQRLVGYYGARAVSTSNTAP